MLCWILELGILFIFPNREGWKLVLFTSRQMSRVFPHKYLASIHASSFSDDNEGEISPAACWSQYNPLASIRGEASRGRGSDWLRSRDPVWAAQPRPPALSA